jgi:hypothetical protein
MFRALNTLMLNRTGAYVSEQLIRSVCAYLTVGLTFASLPCTLSLHQHTTKLNMCIPPTNLVTLLSGLQSPPTPGRKAPALQIDGMGPQVCADTRKITLALTQTHTHTHARTHKHTHTHTLRAHTRTEYTHTHAQTDTHRHTYANRVHSHTRTHRHTDTHTHILRAHTRTESFGEPCT